MYHQIKSAIARYTSFTDEEWKYLLPYFKPLNVKKNTKLKVPEKVATRIYFINMGATRCYFFRDVEEIHTDFFFENSFTTSFSSFLRQNSDETVVETIEDSQLLFLEHNDYQKLNDTLVNFNVFARQLVEGLWVRNETFINSLLLDEPETRLENMLKEQPGIIHRVSQRYIASYLDIPLLSFSRMIEGL